MRFIFVFSRAQTRDGNTACACGFAGDYNTIQSPVTGMAWGNDHSDPILAVCLSESASRANPKIL
jgi:hypothetical protein